jgi:hypothetical protein
MFKPTGMMHKIKKKLNSRDFLSLIISYFSFDFHAKNCLVVPASLFYRFAQNAGLIFLVEK